MEYYRIIYRNICAYLLCNYNSISPCGDCQECSVNGIDNNVTIAKLRSNLSMVCIHTKNVAAIGTDWDIILNGTVSLLEPRFLPLDTFDAITNEFMAKLAFVNNTQLEMAPHEAVSYTAVHWRRGDQLHTRCDCAVHGLCA